MRLLWELPFLSTNSRSYFTNLARDLETEVVRSLNLRLRTHGRVACRYCVHARPDNRVLERAKVANARVVWCRRRRYKTVGGTWRAADIAESERVSLPLTTRQHGIDQTSATRTRG